MDGSDERAFYRPAEYESDSEFVGNRFFANYAEYNHRYRLTRAALKPKPELRLLASARRGQPRTQRRLAFERGTIA